MPNNHRAFRYKIIVQGRSTTIFAGSCTEAVVVFIRSLLRRQRIPSASQLCVIRVADRVIPEVHGVWVQLSEFLHRKADRELELRPDYIQLPEPMIPGRRRPVQADVDAALDDSCDHQGYIPVPQNDEEEAFNDRMLLARLAEVRQLRLSEAETIRTTAVPLDTPYALGASLDLAAGVASLLAV